MLTKHTRWILIRLSSKRLKLFVWYSLIWCAFLVENQCSGQDSNPIRSNAYNANHGNDNFHLFTVCDDLVVRVTDMSLLCDSPGPFLFGGDDKYRNSASCRAGDKAKLDVSFIVQQDLNIEGVSPYVSLYVSGNGRVEGQNPYHGLPLCEVEELNAPDGQSCPQQGFYNIQLQFYWGERTQNDTIEYSFDPKIMIGFSSNPQRDKFDLGCANTNECVGDTTTTWTKKVRKSLGNSVSSFFVTLDIVLVSIGIIFLASWCITKRKEYKTKEVIVQDPWDENEQKKIVLLGNNNNLLVDF